VRQGRALAWLTALLLLPTPCQAHLVNTGLGPLYDGISHFAITPEDLLPALALALFAGQRGARAGRLALFVLPLAWLCGGLAGLAFPTISEARVVAIASLLLLGGLVAAEAPLPARGVAGAAVVLGLLNGYVNGSAMSQARLGALGLAGIVGALFVTVALAAAMVVAIRVPWGRIAVRVAGSWIVAIGLLLLGWSLRGSGVRVAALLPVHEARAELTVGKNDESFIDEESSEKRQNRAVSVAARRRGGPAKKLPAPDVT
jgi:hydrogenase/urease accessory protein HupE